MKANHLSAFAVLISFGLLLGFCPLANAEVIATLPVQPTAELPIKIKLEAINATASVLPVHVQIDRDPNIASAQTTAEIKFTLRCKMRSMRSEHLGVDLDATFDFKLDANQAKLGRWVFIPYVVGDSNTMKFDVLVDGYPCTEFDTTAITLPAFHYDMAILARANPVRPMTPVVFSEQPSASARNSRPRLNHQDAYILTPDRYFENWQNYLAFQGVMVEASILKEMHEQKTPAWDALNKWVIAGGSLSVYGDGQFKLLTELFGNPKPVDEAPLKSLKVDPTEFASRVHNARVAGFTEFENVLIPDQEVLNKFRSTRYGGGNVVSCELVDLKKLSWKHWSLLMPPFQTDDHRRFDVGIDSQRFRFSTSINQKLSGTPVYSFWGLITLFVALVGPLLYWLLKRSKTMYRVYLFVPPLSLFLALATLATVSLLEGKRPREAAVRLTHVESGRSQAEITTETIMSPSREDQRLVTHSSDQFILPTGVVPAVYDSRPYERYGVRGEDRWTIFDRQGDILYGDQAQGGLWNGNLLGTREQRFYVSIEPKLTNKGIRLTDETAPKATNTLDVRLNELLVRDTYGTFWHLEDIESGAVKSLKEMPQTEAVRVMRRIADHLPLIRDEGLSFSVSYIVGIPVFTTRERRSNTTYRGIDFGIPIERRLSEWRMGAMPYNTFLAWSSSDLDRLVLAEGSVIDSKHVLMGTIE